MTVHLLHGFNISDGGENTIRKLEPYIGGDEKAYDFGWTGVIGLRCANKKAVRHIAPNLQPGDVLIGHSNGALICWTLAIEHHQKLAGIILINPALRKDTVWPEGLRVLCIHNKTDWVVQLGRMWSRLVSLGGLNFHGWGAAGRVGFTARQPLVTNWDSATGMICDPVKGHSGLFRLPQLESWGRMINKMAWTYKKLYQNGSD